jgi:hypothetical protein
LEGIRKYKLLIVSIFAVVLLFFVQQYPASSAIEDNHNPVASTFKSAPFFIASGNSFSSPSERVGHHLMVLKKIPLLTLCFKPIDVFSNLITRFIFLQKSSITSVLSKLELHCILRI